jgi:hypothetical protein
LGLLGLRRPFVLVDQAAQDRFSADPQRFRACCGDAGSVVLGVWDALADGLVWPGGVVMLLVFG